MTGADDAEQAGPRGRHRWRARWQSIAIVAAASLAYANSFRGAFVLDDQQSILTNPTLQHLSWAVLHPPAGEGTTVEARPFLNLSFALNHAVSGTDAWSYHAVNLLIHMGGALLLFALLRRLLLRAGVPRAGDVAAFASLLWAIHPLQTESVTYIVQRAESLMGLLYAGTLYCHIRALEADRHWVRWTVAAMICCALGMATKEVMVTAPLVALIIDWILYHDRWAVGRTRRVVAYAALFATWLLLAALQAGHLSRGGTIGEAAGVTSWQYACAQARAWTHYLRLAGWPHPLVFDYGSDFVGFTEVAAYYALTLLAIVATLVGLIRRSPYALFGVWFFVILAPTSSVVGGSRQMVAEHRVYLPLLAPAVAVALGTFVVLGARRGGLVLGAVAAALGLGTAARNSTYASDLTLYRDNFAKRPGSAYGAYNLAYALKERGQTEAARALYDTALRLKPDLADAHVDLAEMDAAIPGREGEALAHYEALLKLKPDVAELHNDYGVLLVRTGRPAEGAAQFETATRLKPGYAEAHFNLGWLRSNDVNALDAAVAEFEAAIRARPNYADAHNRLALLLVRRPGRQADAAAHLRAAIAAKPDFADAYTNLGLVLLRFPDLGGDPVEALRTAAKLQPDSADAHFNLAMALARSGRSRSEAHAELTEALRLNPAHAAALQQLSAGR